jgi:hypothetical protein
MGRIPFKQHSAAIKTLPYARRARQERKKRIAAKGAKKRLHVLCSLRLFAAILL